MADDYLPLYPGPNFADMTQSLFHRYGLRVNVMQQVNDVQTALSLVASDMGFTLVPEQIRRVHREGVDYMPLEDDSITVPVIASRRKGENPNAVMRLANTILDELVENRLTGRYPDSTSALSTAALSLYRLPQYLRGLLQSAQVNPTSVSMSTRAALVLMLIAPNNSPFPAKTGTATERSPESSS